MPHVHTSSLTRQPVLAIAIMGSGAALVAAIFLKTSLALTLSCVIALATLTAVFKWHATPVLHRSALKAQARIGILAGVLGTIGYDLSRAILVWVSGWEFNPFHALVVFGHLLLGERAPYAAVLVAGTAYHLLNGVCFATAYCLFFGRGRHWLWGVAYALCLEWAMFSIYPGWLNLQAVMLEFTVVSVSGHLAYGTIIGLCCQRARRTSDRSFPWGASRDE